MNCRWIRHLNVRPETIKFLEANLGRKLLKIGLSDTFIKLKSYCTTAIPDGALIPG